jgi:hypothetical protein
LLACKMDNLAYQGGLLSDVTYWFFENGYLVLKLMYCSEITQWIPIQLLWIRGLTKSYYNLHFATLFCQFMIPSFTQVEHKTLARGGFLNSSKGRICFSLYGGLWQMQP